MPKLSKNLVSLIFPSRCLGCESELENGFTSSTEPVVDDDNFDYLTTFDDHWCRKCWRQITEDHERPICDKCGVSIHGNNPFQGRCALCHDLHLRFERAIAVGNYRGLLQQLVIRMKNQHDEQLAMQLGYLLANRVREFEFAECIDLVMPVSTHWWTRFRRGFHAAEIIANSVGRACNFKVIRNVVHSLRTTRKQGTLSTPGRFQNVRKAFAVRTNCDITGKHLLVIDDVMTSGATTSEVSKVLLKAGAASVYIGVVARGARLS